MKTKTKFGHLKEYQATIHVDSPEYTEKFGFICGHCGEKVHPHKAWLGEDGKQYHLEHLPKNILTK